MELHNFQQKIVSGSKLTNMPTSSEEGFDISDDYVHKVLFDMKNTDVAFANTIRRSLSTLCPSVAFNPDEKDSIIVISNTSSLHNEFLTHRLGLVPICSDSVVAQELLKLKTKYNPKSGIREWSFVNPDKIPKFIINTNEEGLVLTPNINMNNVVDVTTETFKVFDGEDALDSSLFFKNDAYTNDPIIINCLKSKLDEEGYIDNMHIECHPKISLGKYNTRNDPTGTVEYKFKTKSEDIIESIWRKKLIYMKKERQDNELIPYTDDEISVFKDSFMHLDKYRVFETDDSGNPNHFEFGIESIGFMSATRIVYDSIKHLQLCIEDLINSIHFKLLDDVYFLEKFYSEKLSYADISTLTINKGCIITINNENHTIGNLIQNKMRQLYLIDGNEGESKDQHFLKLANYRMDHPTIEEIEIMMSPKDDISPELMRQSLKKFIEDNPDKFNENTRFRLNKQNITEYFCIYLFIQTLHAIKIDINLFLEQFGKLSNIKKETYECL